MIEPVAGRKILCEVEASLEAETAAALDYFRGRGGVVFLSDIPFWKTHPYVQQSLAKLLTAHAIPVTWFDGVEGAPPLVRAWSSPHLEVRRLPKGERALRRAVRRLGGNPVIWAWSGCPDTVPYLDVLSVFDDPTRATAALCERARAVFCQNRFARSVVGAKADWAPPPVELRPGFFETSHVPRFPSGFPRRRMGYIGSFFARDYDLDLFARLVEEMPDWGFLLMGRTDAAGLAKLARLSRLPNFHLERWRPRDETGGAWRAISVSLLLYKEWQGQHGAYPTKILDAHYFGVPSVATRTRKTESLDGICQVVESEEELHETAVRLLAPSPEKLRVLATEMSPGRYLSRVARRLESFA